MSAWSSPLIFGCWARRVPAIIDTSIGDAWTQIALSTVFRIASSYFGALTSARHQQESLVEVVSDADLSSTLLQGLAGLSDARRRFLNHNNFDELTNDAIQSIEAILTQIAVACGGLEAKQLGIKVDSAAARVLNDAGLWEWHLLFVNDLRRHFDNRHRWSSETELLQLKGHLERLLWTIGVFVSQVDEGHWVDILDEERMLLFSSALRA